MQQQVPRDKAQYRNQIQRLCAALVLPALIFSTTATATPEGELFNPFNVPLSEQQSEELLYSLNVNGARAGAETQYFRFYLDEETQELYLSERSLPYLRVDLEIDETAWFYPEEGIRRYYPANKIPEAESYVNHQALEVSIEFPPELHNSQRFTAVYDNRSKTRTNTKRVLESLTSKKFSAATNYDMSVSNVAGNQLSGGLTLNSIVAWPLTTLEHSHVFSTNLDQTNTTRLRTTIVRDFLDYGAQLAVGDLSSVSTGSGNIFRPGRFYGGIAWFSPDNPDPRYRNLPTTSIEGIALEQSVLEVYQGNQRRLGVAVEPGPFTVDLPASISSNGNANFIVRDILGREQLVEIPFFYNGQVIRKGSYGYSYELGRTRENIGLEPFDYGDWFVSTSHRYGLTENVTIAAEGELSQGFSAVGSRINFGLYALKSSVGISGATSQSQLNGTGSMGSLSIQNRLIPRLPFNIFAAYNERNFKRLKDDPGSGNKWNIRAGTGIPLPRGWGRPLSLTYVASKTHGNDDISQRIIFSKSARLGRTRFQFSGSFDPEEADDSFTLNLSIARPLGRHNVSASSNLVPGPVSTTYRVSRATSRDQIGHQLSYSTNYNDRHSFSAGLAARTELGNGSVNVFSTPQGGANSTSLAMSFNGGIGYAGGKFLAAPSVSGSFAIVQAKDAPNVLLQSDSDSRYTNDSGYALLSGLGPYAENEIGLSRKARLDVFGTAPNINVIPTRGGGVLVDYDAALGRGATATLIDETGEPLPPGTRLYHKQTTEEMYVATQGFSFMLELPNEVTVTAQYGLTRWSCQVVYPETKDPLPDLGEITCAKQNK